MVSGVVMVDVVVGGVVVGDVGVDGVVVSGVTIAEREDDSSFLKLPTMVQDIFLLFKCMNQKIMLKIYVMSWR